MGIEPDGMIGHSVGELGCGYADDSMTAEETVLAAYWRGRCVMEAELPPGAMAAVGKIDMVPMLFSEFHWIYFVKCIHRNQRGINFENNRDEMRGL